MKRYLFCLAAAAVLFSCKKSGVSPQLTGTWELRQMYGGFGYHDSVYVAGNGNKYQFNSNGTYKHFKDGTQDASGTFEYKKKSITFAGEVYDELIFDHAASGDDMVTLNGSKMTMGTTVTDGIASDYQKISN